MKTKTSKFGIRADMLKTLHKVYLYFVGDPKLITDYDKMEENRNLSAEEQREMGRKLAQYYGLKK